MCVEALIYCIVANDQLFVQVGILFHICYEFLNHANGKSVVMGSSFRIIYLQRIMVGK